MEQIATDIRLVPCGKVVIKSGNLVLGDLAYMQTLPESTLVVEEIPQGTYQILGGYSGTTPTIEWLEIVLLNTDIPENGEIEVLGEFLSSSSCIVLTDESNIDKYWQDNLLDPKVIIEGLDGRRAVTKVMNQFGIQFLDNQTSMITSSPIQDVDTLASFLESLETELSFSWRLHANDSFDKGIDTIIAHATRSNSEKLPAGEVEFDSNNKDSFFVCSCVTGKGVYSVGGSYQGDTLVRIYIQLITENDLEGRSE